MSEDVDAGAIAAPGRVLADAGGPCPTDELGRPRSLFRPGDILRVSCALRETEVTSANKVSHLRALAVAVAPGRSIPPGRVE